MSFLLPVNKKIHRTKFEIEEENTKFQIARKFLFSPYFFQLLNDCLDNFHNLWKFWEISPKKIEENQRQSQIIISKHFPLWNPSLIIKIIFLIYTVANDSPILACHLLNAFNDIEKWKHEKFPRKTIHWWTHQCWANTLWSHLNIITTITTRWLDLHVLKNPDLLVFVVILNSVRQLDVTT